MGDRNFDWNERFDGAARRGEAKIGELGGLGPGQSDEVL
ncbi:hypothetical protein E2C01_101798 [Portunus trituberculatus]|uniref:Uncharacterized protein n=1 Tax=Portunus trituberculatus TaxID=210409 RepID=A0A5B7KL83_PORTR|nr:hypothetical protein [Portunus trituberculatus]